MAGVRRDEDFAAWQLAEAFKKELFRLVRGSPEAFRDFRYRDQLRNAAGGISKHITEGFLRFSPLDFARFLDYALGSLGEAERRLRDGIELEYFAREDCCAAFQLAKRCSVATRKLNTVRFDMPKAFGNEIETVRETRTANLDALPTSRPQSTSTGLLRRRNNLLGLATVMSRQPTR